MCVIFKFIFCNVWVLIYLGNYVDEQVFWRMFGDVFLYVYNWQIQNRCEVDMFLFGFMRVLIDVL